MKKFGGVKITMQRANTAQPRGAINLRTPGDCPCGKSCADCDDEWDRKLGITGRSADQYSDNLAKVRRAQLEGHDAYHTKLRREADGETESWDWTPHMPPGTLRVPLGDSSNESDGGTTKTSSRGATHGTTGRAGNQRKRGSRTAARRKRG